MDIDLLFKLSRKNDLTDYKIELDNQGLSFELICNELNKESLKPDIDFEKMIKIITLLRSFVVTSTEHSLFNWVTLSFEGALKVDAYNYLFDLSDILYTYVDIIDSLEENELKRLFSLMKDLYSLDYRGHKSEYLIYLTLCKLISIFFYFPEEIYEPFIENREKHFDSRIEEDFIDLIED